MKKPIYNAIQNQLIIDGSDSSINYRKTEITSEYEYVMSLDELNDIYKKNHEDIFEIPYSAISFILDDNTEIPLSKYQYGMVVMFLKIYDGNNAILMAAEDSTHSGDDLLWQKLCYGNNKYTEIDIERTSDAYDNCKKLLEKSKTNPDILSMPAIKYCLNQIITLKNTTYQGYLPSLKQLQTICKYQDMIMYIFKYIMVNCCNINYGYWWTSDEFDNECVHCIKYGHRDVCMKDAQLSVLPLFTEKRN